MKLVNEDRELFNKAALAGAKKCAPCEYAKAEAYLALAWIPIEGEEPNGFCARNG
jgi:hypothetical protein